MVCTLTGGRNDVMMFKSMQIFEYFVVISMVDKRTNHGKLLSPCFFIITLTVLTSISFEVSGSEIRAHDKENNKLRHYHAISIICTLTEYSSRATSVSISFSYGRK